MAGKVPKTRIAVDKGVNLDIENYCTVGMLNISIYTVHNHMKTRGKNGKERTNK